MVAVRMLVTCALVCACGKSSKPNVEGEGSARVAPASHDAAALALADAGADAPTVPADAAKVAEVPCTAPAIAAARRQADAHVKAGKFDDAIALLDTETCFLDEEQEPALQKEIAWRLSDLAFAYYKAGRYAPCYAIAAAQVTPYIGNVGSVFAETDKVVGALEYNAKLCHDAAAKERGTFEPAGKCTLVADAYALPASVLDPADRAACLVIEGGKKDDDDFNVCGDVVLVRQPKTGKRTRTKLVVEGNLAEGGVCCNIEGVGFGKRGDKLAILVETQGRDCNGGTASSEEQHTYELHGDELELVHTLGAVAH